MNDMIFDILFNAEYTGVEEGRAELSKLKQIVEDINKDGINLDKDNDIDKINAKVKLLEETIRKTEQSGGDFGKNFREMKAEADKATLAVDSTRKSIDRLQGSSPKGFQTVSKAARLATQDIRGTESSLDKLRTNMEQGIGQTLAFGAIGAMSGAVLSAVGNVSKLDEVMTDISIVSGKSRSEMEAYRDAAGDAADKLGTMTEKYLKASLIYEQQGGDAARYAKELADSTVVAANISNVATDQMSEYLTSTINGFQLLKEKGGEAGTYVTDVLAKLGAASGSDLAEVATGLTRVASTAKDAGYTFEEISAMISTVSEVTRKSPETIGNAFKSILSSFTQLKEKSVDEVKELTSKVEAAFQSANLDISIFDDNGRLRDAADIFKDIAASWGDMSKEQQALVASNVAGKYQMENFLVFMNNQERYTELLETAYSSAGTAANQQLIYMDSMKAKTEQLKGAWQQTSALIVNSDMFKGIVGDLTNMLKIVNNMGGGFKSLATLAAPIAGIFGNMFGASKIKEAVSTSLANSFTPDFEKLQKDMEAAEERNGKLTESRKREIAEIVELKKQEYQRGKEMNDVEKQLGRDAGARYNAIVNQTEELRNQLNLIDEMQNGGEENYLNNATRLMETKGGFAGIDTQRYRNDKEEIKSDLSIESISNATDKLNEARKSVEDINVGITEVKTNFKSIDNLGTIIGTNLEQMELSSLNTEANTNAIETAYANIVRLTQEEATEGRTSADIKADIKENIEIINIEQSKFIEQQEIELKNRQNNVKLQEKELENAAGKVAIRRQVSEKGGTKDTLNADLIQTEQQAAKLEKAAKLTKLATNATRVASTMTAIVPLVATVKGAMDGVVSTQDAVVAGTQTLGMTLMSTMNPPLMIIGALTTGFGLLAKATDMFTSKVEKAKKHNDELIKSVMSMRETLDKQKTTLVQVAEGYEKLQGLSADAILIPGNEQTEEQKALLETYLDVADKMSETFPELIKYYDDQGRAVLDLSQNYGELILKQREAQMSADDMMASNAQSFWLEYSTNLEKAQKALRGNDLVEAQKELKEAQESGNEKSINEALKNIEKMNQKLVENQTTITETRSLIQGNIVEPFIATVANVDTADSKIRNLVKDFASTHFNSTILDSLVGEENGEERIEAIKNNVKLITDEIQRQEQANAGSGAKLLEDINATYSAQEQAMAITVTPAKNFEELQKQLAGTKTLFTDTIGITNELNDAMDDLGVSADNVSDINKVLKEQLDNADAQVKHDVASQIDTEPKEYGAFGDYYMYGYTGQGTNSTQGAYTDYTQKAVSETSGFSGEEAEKAQKINELLIRKSELLQQQAEGYRKSRDSVEGLAQAEQEAANIDITKGMLGDVDKFGGLEAVIGKIKELMPELGASMEEAFNQGTDAATVLSMGMDGVQIKSATMAQGIVGDSTEYFSTWKEQNGEAIAQLQERFDIDMSSITTLDELKAAAMESELKNADETAKATTGIDAKKYGTMEENTSKFTKAHGEAVWNMVSEEEKANMVSKAQTAAIAASKLSTWDVVSTGIKSLFSGKGVKGYMEALAQADADSAERAQKAFDESIEKSIADKKQQEEWIKNSEYAAELAKNYEAGIDAQKYNEYTGIVSRSNFGNIDDYAKKMEEQLQAAQEAAKNIGTGTGTDTDSGLGDGEKDSESKVADLELELDRYYKLDNILTKISNQFKELNTAKSAAYGEDKLKLMDKERDLINKQASATKAYVAELKKEQSELRGKLGSNGFGFDSNGDISNFNERLKAMQDAANRLSGDAKEAAIENVKKLQEEAQRYQQITFNLIPDKENTLKELKNQISSLAKEKIEYKLKLKLDKDSFKSDLFEVLKEMQDSYDKLDEKAQLTGKQMAQSLDQVKYYQDLINSTQNNKDLNEADRTELVEKYKSALLSAVSDSRKYYNELIEIQQEWVSQSLEAVNKVSERYNNLITKSQNMIDKMKELYGYKNYEQMAKMYEVQENALNGQLQNLQAAQAEMIKYRDSLEKGTESWEAANDAVNQLGQSIEDTLLKKLELLKTQFNEFTNSLLDNFDKMFGTWGLTGAIDDFNKLIEKQDKYLNGFEKYTNISMKIKSINDEIAKTNDPARAAALVKYRDEELAVLMEQDKVSKDDFERAQRLYEIKLKELALQERQDAKRMAQLVRDANGNMSYEYVRQETADTSKELEELQKEKDDLYQFDSDKVKESAQGVFDIIQQYQSKIKELQDKGLSPEEYEKELKKMLDDATTDIQEKTEEMNKWIENAGKDGMSNLQTMIQNGVITPDALGTDSNTLNSIFQAMSDGSLSISDMMSGNFDDFASSIGMSADELQGTMDSLLELVLGDNLDIAQAMMDASNKWTSTAQENVNSLGDAYAEYMSMANDVLNKYGASTDKLNNSLNQTNDAAKQVIDTINKQSEAMNVAKQKTDVLSNSTLQLQNKLIGANGKSGLYGSMVQLQLTMNNQLQPSMVSTGSQTDILSDKTYNSAIRYNQMAGEARGAYERVAAFTDQRTKESMGRIDEITGKTNKTADAFNKTAVNADDAKKSIQEFSQEISKLQGYGSLQVSSSGGKAVGMASGGYTGTWENSTNNSTGKLAVLHEKELVLNSKDTENILEAVNMQRRLATTLSNVKSATNRIVNNTVSNINNVVNNQNETTKEMIQPVTIHASFPGVSNRVEIESAFNGLMAKASTYISKR